MNEKMIKDSMDIILNAGDARLECKQALDYLAEFDTENAKLKLDEAQKKITEAHKIQTAVIHSEAGGDETEYSVLFAHAQDTLMTIYSEINIARQMIKIFEAYEERIKKIEERG